MIIQNVVNLIFAHQHDSFLTSMLSCMFYFCTGPLSCDPINQDANKRLTSLGAASEKLNFFPTFPKHPAASKIRKQLAALYKHDRNPPAL